MAFDPNLPANNSPVSSAELRGQFTGLMTEIESRPVYEEVGTMITDQSAGKPEMAPLSLTISNPPTQQEVQTIVEAFNNLLDSLKRA